MLADKFNLLKKKLRSLKSVVIGFSGGVDSSFLVKTAYDVLGEKALAVTVESPFFSTEEKINTRRITGKIGIEHVVLPLRLPSLCFRNTKERCYYCKRAVFKAIRAYAAKRKIKNIIDASHLDDLGDYRPGRRALKELKVRSLLLECGFAKDDIRELSRKIKLETADKESSCCLATRFPYGERITPEKLGIIERAEQYLRRYGFRKVRARYYGETVRIEVKHEDIPLVFEHAKKITNDLKKEGFTYVTVDLEGYRQGALNEVLRHRA